MEPAKLYFGVPEILVKGVPKPLVNEVPKTDVTFGPKSQVCEAPGFGGGTENNPLNGSKKRPKKGGNIFKNKFSTSFS